MLVDQIKSYLLRFPHERPQLAGMVEDLRSNAKPHSRFSLPGHITASGIVINDAKLLTVFHPFLMKWLQPGGHIEAGESPIEAAEREIHEETGALVAVHPWHHISAIPLDIDVHPIPANTAKGEVEHLHYDFRYLFNFEGMPGILGKGVLKTSWKSVEEIDEPHLQRLVFKLRNFGLASS